MLVYLIANLILIYDFSILKLNIIIFIHQIFGLNGHNSYYPKYHPLRFLNKHLCIKSRF